MVKWFSSLTASSPLDGNTSTLLQISPKVPLPPRVPTILQLHDNAVWIAEIDLRSALLAPWGSGPRIRTLTFMGPPLSPPLPPSVLSDTVRGQHGQNAVHGEVVDSDAEVADTWRI